MIYFTSDLHFFWNKDPRVGTRHFATASEKNEFVIERWNKTVSPADEVYILGDASNGDAAQTAEIIRRLNGTKYLVRGNNDRYLDDESFDTSVFAWVKDYCELHVEDAKFVLFHFPIEAWSGYKNDSIHVHGHVHRLKPVWEHIRRYECGIDASGGTPVSAKQVYDAVKDYHNLDRKMPGLW